MINITLVWIIYNMVTIYQFIEKFGTNVDCLIFLMEVMWGEGYKCPTLNAIVPL